MTTQHAPGEWGIATYGQNRYEIQGVLPSGMGTRVAVVDRIEDARLFKAAPKLLAALEAVTTAFGEHLIDMGGPDPEDRYTAILNQALAAIALTREK